MQNHLRFGSLLSIWPLL